MTNDRVKEYLKTHPWVYSTEFDCIVRFHYHEEDFKIFWFGSVADEFSFELFEVRKLIKNNFLFRTKREAQEFRKKVKELTK